MSSNEDIINTLRCTTCSNYLMQPPLYLTPECNNICGRCPIPEDAIRNLALERVVSKILFSCKNQKNGCQVKMLAPELLNHENKCFFQRYSCPVTPNGSCQWIGRFDHILSHCQNEHNQQILLENPFRLFYKETKSVEEFFIISIYKSLFVVQYKQDLEKFMLNILLIGKSCSHFKFTLEIKNNENKFIRKQFVQPVKTFTFLEDDSIKISFKSIQDFIGSLDSTEFNINIENLDNNCTNCSLNEKVFKVDKRFCKYKYKGCNFADTIPKIDKHEEYFCSFNTWCYICNYYISTSKLKHFLSHNNITYKCEKFISIMKCNMQQILILNSKFGSVICCLDTSDSFYIEIYSCLESNDLLKYKLEIVLKNQCGTQTIGKIMDTCYDNQYDWNIDIPEKHFETLFTTNNIFLMNITISMN